jgi:hypothetical protein
LAPYVSRIVIGSGEAASTAGAATVCPVGLGRRRQNPNLPEVCTDTSGKVYHRLNVTQDDHMLRCYRYWGVFWIDASTCDSIRRCLTQIAVILQVEKDIDSVKRVLANTSHVWLLVFDNADDPDLSVAPYFPAGDRGDIIITSRNPECRQYHTVGWREIGGMSYDDS